MHSFAFVLLFTVSLGACANGNKNSNRNEARPLEVFDFKPHGKTSSEFPTNQLNISFEFSNKQLSTRIPRANHVQCRLVLTYAYRENGQVVTQSMFPTNGDSATCSNGFETLPTDPKGEFHSEHEHAIRYYADQIYTMTFTRANGETYTASAKFPPAQEIVFPASDTAISQSEPLKLVWKNGNLGDILETQHAYVSSDNGEFTFAPEQVFPPSSENVPPYVRITSSDFLPGPRGINSTIVFTQNLAFHFTYSD